MIPPTIGRKVWYWPHQAERSIDGSQPFDATIVYVWHEGLVNLAVLNEFGRPVPDKTSVRLAQDAENVGPGDCQWMPYQMGQAKAVADVGTVLGSSVKTAEQLAPPADA